MQSQKGIKKEERDWLRYQEASFASCRARFVEKSFPVILHQEGPWSRSHALRFITATSLLMVRLIKAAC